MGTAPRHHAPRHAAGFTLVEVLVALVVLAMLALLSWRALDGMSRAQSAVQAHSGEALARQATLSQWTSDLDQMMELPFVRTIAWDGLVLRITRRNPQGGASGPIVVAWTLQRSSASGLWMRWQSPPVTTRNGWQQAWDAAEQWARGAPVHAGESAVATLALRDWAIYYYRGNSWTHPQSSGFETHVPAPGTNTTNGNPGTAPEELPLQDPPPDGVRITLQLADAAQGNLTVDWARWGEMDSNR